MKKYGAWIALAAVMALLPAGLAEGKRPLRSETTHTPGADGFAGQYLQAWEGPITGGIIDKGEAGWIEWWVDVETWTSWPYIVAGETPPNASHYTMEVKIFDAKGGDLILRTVERGTTTMANTSWRANGVVVEAPDHPHLIGRRVHESGRFEVAPTPDGGVAPVSGESIFRIN